MEKLQHNNYFIASPEHFTIVISNDTNRYSLINSTSKLIPSFFYAGVLIHDRKTRKWKNYGKLIFFSFFTSKAFMCGCGNAWHNLNRSETRKEGRKVRRMRETFWHYLIITFCITSGYCGGEIKSKVWNKFIV